MVDISRHSSELFDMSQHRSSSTLVRKIVGIRRHESTLENISRHSSTLVDVGLHASTLKSPSVDAQQLSPLNKRTTVKSPNSHARHNTIQAEHPSEPAHTQGASSSLPNNTRVLPTNNSQVFPNLYGDAVVFRLAWLLSSRSRHEKVCRD